MNEEPNIDILSKHVKNIPHLEINVNETDVHNKYVLDRLYSYDKELFDYNADPLQGYARSCQNDQIKNRNRQPIVINKKEKAIIDSKHPGSYSGYVKTGSTDTLKEDNYYICPDVWCPIDGVPMTKEQYKSQSSNCKLPLHFSDNDKDLYPGFLSKAPNHNLKDTNPPCCFFNEQNGLVNNEHYVKRKEKKGKQQPGKRSYILRLSNYLEDMKYGFLPETINELLNSDNKDCKKTRDCYVRLGVNNNDLLLNCLVKILDNENIKDVKSLKNLIVNSMNTDPKYYIFLNNGYNLKTYYNSDKNITEWNNYVGFKEWFLNFEKKKKSNYIYEFNLDSVLDAVKKIKSIKDLIKNDEYKKICREYIIYNSLKSYLLYIESDISKTIDDIYSLLHFDWLNPKQKNIFVIEDGKDMINIHIAKYYNMIPYVNQVRDFCFIVNYDNTSYPVVKVLKSRDEHNINFTFSEDNWVNKLVNTFMKNYKMTNEKPQDNTEKYILVKLINDVNILKHGIRAYLIDYNYKCCGLLLNNDISVLLKDYEELNMIEDVSDSNYKKLYINEIQSMNLSIKKDDANDLFEKLNTDHGMKHLIDNKGIYTLNTQYIPNVDDSYNNTFIQYSDNTTIIDFGRKYMESQHKYLNMLHKLSHIAQTYKYKTDLYYVKHELNPMNSDRKIDVITHILEEEFKKHNIEKNVRKQISNDLYRNDHSTVVYKLNLYKKHIAKNNNYFFTLRDIINDKMLKIHEVYENPYKILSNTFEDYVSYAPLYVNDIVNDVNDIIKIKVETVNEDIQPLSLQKKMRDYQVMDYVNDYTNESIINTLNYVLEILNKPLVLKSKDVNDLIETEVLKSFNNESLRTKLLQNLKQNDVFLNRMKTTSEKITKANIIEIMKDKDYKFHIYELKVLGAYMKINIFILTGNLIMDPMYLNMDYEYYILFNLYENKFKLITHKNTKKCVFLKHQLPDNIKNKLN